MSEAEIDDLKRRWREAMKESNKWNNKAMEPGI